jgi:hypothetical protein
MGATWGQGPHLVQVGAAKWRGANLGTRKSFWKNEKIAWTRCTIVVSH